MKVGKLDSKLLEELVFKNIAYQRPEVLERPGIGKDCAVIDFGDYDCIMSTDPITAAISEIGRLAVHISCNDIATCGIEPLGIMLAVLLPTETTEKQVEDMMEQAGEAAAELHIEIIGGHTEITTAVIKPVIVSTAIGRRKKDLGSVQRVIKPGDAILMTKFAGIEGTGIIASDFEDQLKSLLSPEELREAKSLLDQVSVVAEGKIAGEIGVLAMHDITEGGVLGAVWEMCEIAGSGADIAESAIPILPVTRKICSHFKIDPLKLISSGCMLIVASPEKKEALVTALSAARIQVSEIGSITTGQRRLLVDNGAIEIMPPESDELYKVVL